MDPRAREVRGVETDGGHLSIRELLGLGDRPFDVVRIDQRNVLYIDDEGLYQGAQRFFMWDGRSHFLAGTALLLGVDGAGESVDTSWLVGDVQAAVTWLPEGTHLLRFEELVPTRVETPFGPMVQVGSRAVFHVPGRGEVRNG